jgi:type I restriction enzyme S subunit
MAFDNLPKGWQIKRLGDPNYFKRLGGGTPKRSIKEYWENGTVSWVTNAEIPEDRLIHITQTKEKITELGLHSSSATLVPRDCVLLGCTGSIGKVAIAGIDLSTNQQFNSFECNDNKIIPKLLAYFLMTSTV